MNYRSRGGEMEENDFLFISVWFEIDSDTSSTLENDTPAPLEEHV